MNHLSEMALEALASGRDDLVEPAEREHAESCEACAILLELERESVGDASLGLRRAMPDLPDLDHMIARAMASATVDTALDGSLVPSRRSLWIGAGVGVLAAFALALLSLRDAPSIGAATALGRQSLTLARAMDSLVAVGIPGGWPTVAGIALLLGLLLAWPARAILFGRGLANTAALLLAVATIPANLAHAYELDGAWPEPQPRVTVDVDGRPTSEALRLATEAAGIGLAAQLPSDPVVTLHVRDVPLSDVVEALLGDAPVVVRPRGPMLVVRPAPADAPIPPAPPVPPAPPSPPVLASANPPAPPDNLGDRVTFGSDVEIGTGDAVRSVYTMGGDALVRGRAYGDVVTMGGDAEIVGEVVGNVTTMGGDIRVRDTARVHGDLNAMGGSVNVDDHAWVRGERVSAPGAVYADVAVDDADDHESAAAEIVRRALWHAVLFLFGLVLFGAARARFATVRDDLAAYPVRNVVGGLIATVGALVLAAVLVVTLIGIPGALLIVTLFFVGGNFGVLAVAWWLGSVLPLPSLKNRPVPQLAAGMFLLFVVGIVPGLGGLLDVLVFAAGFGAVVATRFGREGRGAKLRHVPTGPFR